VVTLARADARQPGIPPKVIPLHRLIFDQGFVVQASF
jgi:hypothetical protein